MGAHWRNLANTIQPSMCGCDPAFLSNYFDHLLTSFSSISSRLFNGLFIILWPPCVADADIIMAALCNSAGHYIFALWFVSSIYLLSFFFLA